MDRHSVKRLLGPLEELLKRNFEVYEKYTAAAQWLETVMPQALFEGVLLKSTHYVSIMYSELVSN